MNNARSPAGSGSRSPVGGVGSSGSRSPIAGGADGDSNGIESKLALRKAVWERVLETASKQKVKLKDNIILTISNIILFLFQNYYQD